MNTIKEAVTQMQRIKIAEGEYAHGVFTSSLHEEGGTATIDGYEYTIWIENDELILATPEVDIYHAMQQGRPWEEVVAVLVDQAVTQLEAAGDDVNEETVGNHLAQNGHFLLPEDIIAALWGRKKKQPVVSQILCWIRDMINPPEKREPQMEPPLCERCRSRLCFSYRYFTPYCPKCDEDGGRSIGLNVEEWA